MSQGNKNGFTLIELMLAMTFISFLMLAIALTTVQISRIYTKGITLREVNQAGRTVSDDLKRSIASATPFELATNYVAQDGGGRLCLGKYSYVWNTGAALANTNTNAQPNKYTDNTPVTFAKVEDASAALCKTPSLKAEKNKSAELLTSGDRSLVLHQVTISSGAIDTSTSQALYSLSLVIGTNGGNELITTGDGSCKPPSDANGDEDYCSVNKFDIIARAGNQAEGNN